MLYAGAIFDAFRRISLTVASVSPAPRFHLGACMKSSEGATPGIRSEVGASFGRLSHVLVASGTGLCAAKRFCRPYAQSLLGLLQRLGGPFFSFLLLSILRLHALKLVIDDEPLKREPTQAQLLASLTFAARVGA